MLQAGVIVSDYATLMVEVLSDTARPEAADVYCAIDALGQARGADCAGLCQVSGALIGAGPEHRRRFAPPSRRGGGIRVKPLAA